MLWKLTVPMNKAIVHNTACNAGTTLVCIDSGVIFIDSGISKSKVTNNLRDFKIIRFKKSEREGKKEKKERFEGWEKDINVSEKFQEKDRITCLYLSIYRHIWFYKMA